MKKNACIMLATLSLLACSPQEKAGDNNAEFDYSVEKICRPRSSTLSRTRI